MNITSRIFLDNPVKKGQKSRIIAEIFVDDVSELPESTGIDNYELVQGSLAYVIHSDELFIMDSFGKWFSSSGEAFSAYSMDLR
ncbi:MAG: hypothetical protein K2J39_09845 [Ruminococcus sp.]|nr:hypothetical protein [Ruminococcus sp.]